MKMTRQHVEQIAARLDEYQETALQSTGRGSYRVRLRSEMTTHSDFTDLPILAAGDGADEAKRIAILAAVRSYTLAFFNEYLRGVNSELLKETAPKNEFVDAVQRFEPARFPCPTE